MRIILASKSPRRKEILSNIGLEFEAVGSNFDETLEDNIGPVDAVKYLAMKKAEEVAKSVDGEALVIGADTVVVLDSEIMGKPVDREQSFEMLSRLSGKWHKVYTGISVTDTSTLRHVEDYEVTDVKIKSLSEGEIINYINSGEPSDKAGSYAIQGKGSLIVEKIEGCYFNVVGLPVYKLSTVMKQFGIRLL